MPNHNQRAWLKHVALALLCVYWLTLLTGTHMPRPPESLTKLGPSDKWLHLMAYCGLASLLSWNWALRRSFGWRQALAILALAASFGALDEITQPLVGRDCEWFDWTSDLLGAALGIAAFFALRAFLRVTAPALRRA